MGTIHQHIRANVVAYAAMFLALTASAAALPGSETVQSNDLKPNAVKGKHIKDGQVRGADVGAESLTGADIAPDSLQGEDIDESSLSISGGGPPSGPAGGDLAGTYPNPQIAANAIGTAEVGLDALSGADILESTLTGVAPGGPASGDLAGTYPNPQLAPGSVTGAEIVDTSVASIDIANDSVNNVDIKDSEVRSQEVLNDSLTGADINESSLATPQMTGNSDPSCDPASATQIACVTHTFTPVGGTGIAMATVDWHSNTGGARGLCDLHVIGTVDSAALGENTNTSDSTHNEEASLMSLVGLVPGEETTLSVRCSELESDLVIDDVQVAIVVGP